MRILKGMLKTVFWLVMLALLVLPVGLIYEISNREMEEYEPPKMPILSDTSYGEVVQAYRTNIEESIMISGQFTSNTYAYMELKQEKPSLIRWNVNVGDEIQEGQVLGVYQGTNVVSTLIGILKERNAYGEDSYLKVLLLKPLELECSVSASVLSTLKREGVELKTQKGEVVTLLWSAVVPNADGTINVKLSIESDSYYYGQKMENLKLVTGNVYQNVLALDKDCVYQKEKGEDEPWYARRVTKEGTFLMEVELSVGYETADMICVSGNVNEGDYFDSGYKAIVEGE